MVEAVNATDNKQPNVKGSTKNALLLIILLPKVQLDKILLILVKNLLPRLIQLTN